MKSKLKQPGDKVGTKSLPNENLFALDNRSGRELSVQQWSGGQLAVQGRLQDFYCRPPPSFVKREKYMNLVSREGVENLGTVRGLERI